ncbi:MAG: hypothetical protein KIT72_00815 [Polyangiaceae bacterium]|nr:hypothetical protein [Polyangiaceae bacterium]MCW5788937.1 hypothetical protein [Polyangiaceae bacterium]
MTARSFTSRSIPSLAVALTSLALVGTACSLTDTSDLSSGSKGAAVAGTSGSGGVGGTDSGGSGGSAGGGAASGGVAGAGATGGSAGTGGGGGSAGDGGSAPLAQGLGCHNSDECESGHCVDGVCCDTACDGPCVACSAERVGGGVDGTCAPITAGADPDSECLDQGSASCGTSGACDGHGACQLYPAATVCSPSSCSEGVRTLPSLCDGSGNCVAGTTEICDQDVCDQDVCLGQCSADSQCAGADRYCELVSASCRTVLDVGQACERGAQCASGHCVQGVCCDTACNSTCESCLAAHKASGANGTCGPTRNGTDPLSQCEDQGAASCGTNGLCNGARGCRLYTSGTVCGASSCREDGQYQPTRHCDGSGVCAATPSVSCYPRRCNAEGCISPCALDSHCAEGHNCDLNGKCARAQALASKCNEDAECASRLCVEGVCCDSACEGACFSCKTGKVAGECGPTKLCTTPECNGACDKYGVCHTDQACF